jgi:heme-degrading monooxygenase HmoA
MAHILIEQKIPNWPDFERRFKQDSERRRILGSKSAQVFRSAKDPKSVFVVFEWEDMESAQKFASEWEATVSRYRVHVAEEAFELDA